MTAFRNAVSVSILALALAACGGESGSSNNAAQPPVTSTAPAPAPTPTPTEPPTPVRTAQALGCQSRSASYPWGQGALERWTPAPWADDVGADGALGQPFDARLVQAFGRDTQFSSRTAIFEFADGCRRQFETRAFIDSDVRRIASAIAEHPAPFDFASYRLNVAKENQVTQAQVDSGQVKVMTTQHFAMIYGTQTDNFSYRDVRRQGMDMETFLRIAGSSLEESWGYARDLTAAPMPYADDNDKQKINVYVCGTGLPFFPDGDDRDCGASAAQAMYMSTIYLKDGSTTITHEFGHVLQLHSGGYRDVAAAGPVWETGANWLSFTSSPVHDGGAIYYFSNLENGPLWSHARYGAFPYMTYLHEEDPTNPFLWTTWTDNSRTQTGATTEEWTQALVRLAQIAGVYPQRYDSLADDMGWYGARLVGMDFLARRSFNHFRESDFVANFYTPLRSTPVQGEYRSSVLRPLLQWGTHIVPLTMTASTVSATVTGGTVANDAAWRFSIVEIAADQTIRYTPLASVEGLGQGATALEVRSGSEVFLAITATPGEYESLGWQQEGAVSGQKFPYSVRLTGATPLSGDGRGCTSVQPNRVGQNLNYNSNGRTTNPVRCPR